MELLPAVHDGGGMTAEGKPRVPQTQRPGARAGGVESGLGGVEGGGRADTEGLPGVGEAQMVGRAVDQPTSARACWAARTSSWMSWSTAATAPAAQREAHRTHRSQ